jgi:pyruvate/2-oxoglutarate dehydrogenase complex dihydrolipoamide dehydrogenase (E3) component
VAPGQAEASDVAVVGAGPAGIAAALRAALLGARTTLVSRAAFGGMAANDGPVPVRALAHAGRLVREARHLPLYGIAVSDPAVDYSSLLARVAAVTAQVRERSLLRDDLEGAGVVVLEHAGAARFVDERTVQCAAGRVVRAERFVVCTGGRSRPLPVAGAELTVSHSAAWGLTAIPESLLVIGAGATGVQVASIFNAFGTQVSLLEVAPRILVAADEDVSAAMAIGLRAAGVDVYEGVAGIERFERCSAGTRTVFRHAGEERNLDAAFAVVAIGWIADVEGPNLGAIGVETDRRGYVQTDAALRTTAPHVFAAGDVTGRGLLVHEAIRQGYVAGTNAALGSETVVEPSLSPVGSFTDPEYGSVGVTEAAAREEHDVTVATVSYDSIPRPLIDGRPDGFCKLVVDRRDHAVLGCHVVGERAVELVQQAAIAMAAGMKVEDLAQVSFAFPTYSNALGRASIRAAIDLGVAGSWAADVLVAR